MKIKIKNPRHLVFLLLGILVFVILGGAVIFYWHYYTTDELAELAPAEVALFVQIKKPILFSHAMSLDNSQLAALYQNLDNYLAWNLDWQKDILPIVNKQVAMLITAGNQKIMVFKTTDREIASKRFKDYNHFWLKKNIIALTDGNFDLAEVFKNTAEENLAAKLGDRFKPFGLVKVYLNFTQLPAVISQFSAGNSGAAKVNFGENQLYKKFEQFKDAVVIINWRADTWQFKLIPGLINFSDDQLINPPEVLITDLFKDYLFFGRNLSLKDLANFNFLNNDLSFKYLKDELLPRVFNNFDLLIFFDSGSQKLKYILAFKLKEQRIARMAPPADSADDLFKEKFQKFVALNWPQKAVKILLDKSRVVELVANPDYYQFEILGDDVYYLTAGVGEIGYQLKEDRLIIANSQSYLLGKSSDRGSLVSKIRSCWLDYPARFLLWQADFGLGFKEVLLKLDQDFVFSGCLH